MKFAEKAHEGQVRKSGEPYIIYPLKVAIGFWAFYQDKDLAIVGLLHDTVEDCLDLDIETIYQNQMKLTTFTI